MRRGVFHKFIFNMSIFTSCMIEKETKKSAKTPSPRNCCVHNAADVFVEVTKISVEYPNQTTLEIYQ